MVSKSLVQDLISETLDEYGVHDSELVSAIMENLDDVVEMYNDVDEETDTYQD